jgi:hypothetical protein
VVSLQGFPWEKVATMGNDNIPVKTNELKLKRRNKKWVDSAKNSLNSGM